MHELAVCQSLIDAVERVARAHGCDQVTRVLLAIGVLSGVEPDQLARAFEIARAGTVAAGAELQIRSVPAEVVCAGCGATSAAHAQRLVCGACGDWHVRVSAGVELLLQSVELVTDKRGERCAEPAAVR